MLRRAQRKKIFLTSLLALFWLGSLAYGLGNLFSYETAAGPSGHATDSWPDTARIHHAPDQYTLVMLAHPHCPCTKASMAELAEIMAQTQHKLSAYVLFLKPENSGPGWDDTALRREAAKIPGVTVVTDFEGVEAARFGAETSGHTLLFDSKGRRVFSGGITASRGHSGGNAGESAVVTLVNGGRPDRNDSLVFGCALTNDKDTTN